VNIKKERADRFAWGNPTIASLGATADLGLTHHLFFDIFIAVKSNSLYLLINISDQKSAWGYK
jgi:hypothetical protein